MHNMTITKRGSFNTVKEINYGCGSTRVGGGVNITYDVELDITGHLKGNDQYFDHREIDQYFRRFDGQGNRKSLERLCLTATEGLRKLVEGHGLKANSVTVELNPVTEDDAIDHYVSAKHTWHQPLIAATAELQPRADVDHSSRHALTA